MYRTQNMTEIPVDVASEIFRKLEQLGLHPVHRAFSSMLEDDNALITVLVYDENAAAQTPLEAYGVVDYDTDNKYLVRWTDAMSYADALIEMGSRIKE